MNLDTFTPAQRESVCHLEGPLFIAAGAGSGKTFTLQQRIAYALLPESGPALESIDQVLAITFTKKAAAEIKARVRSALRAEGMPEEALKVDSAWISTIHGMCSRVLREYALEAGVDPRFSVVTGYDEAQLKDEAFDLVLSQHGEDDDIKSLLSEYSVRANGQRGVSVYGMVFSLMSEAAAFADGLEAVSLYQGGLSVSGVAKSVLLPYEAGLGLAECFGGKPTATQQKTRLACEEAVLALTGFLASGSNDPRELANVLCSCGAPAKNGFGKQAGEAGAECSIAIQTALDRAFMNLNATAALPHAHALIRLTSLVEEAYCALLDKNALVDNNGLLHRTYKLLRDNPDIAARYQSNFKLVMVDEFQDTNQLQVDLIKMMAGSDRLCTVGDAQQSIYRFNGADVSVFNRQRSRVSAPGEQGDSDSPALVARLDDNFRSHGDVLAFVRKVCSQPDVFGDAFLDLRAARKEEQPFKGSGARIAIQMVEYEGQKAQAVEAEARGIARRFAELREAGYQAYDMVVLLGRMTNADIYAAALRDRGFSCVFDGGRSFFTLEEVKVVANVLTAIANPADTQALFAALTSPFWRLSADDFLQLSTVQCETEPRPHRQSIDRGLAGLLHSEDDVFLFDSPSPALVAAAKVFEAARSRIATEKPSQVLMGLLEDSGWLLRLQNEGVEGVSRAANVLKAVRMVEEIEAKPGYGLAQTARDFREMSQTMSDAPGSLSVKDQNAVSIMTIHKSKGLEFPIVAAASYEPVRPMSGSFVCSSSEGKVNVGLSLKRNSFEYVKKLSNAEACEPCADLASTPDAATYRASLIANDYEESLAESCRLFYVAATRASEYLLVSGIVPLKPDLEAAFKNAPIFNHVRSALVGPVGEFPSGSASLEYGGSGPAEFEKISILKVGEGDLEPEEQPSSSSSAPPATLLAPAGVSHRPFDLKVYDAASARPNVFSYSAIAPHDTHVPGQAVPILADDDDEPKPLATDVGSAFHRLAQLSVEQLRDGSTALAKPVDAHVDALCRRYGLEGKYRDRLDAALDRWFASDVARSAEAFGPLRAEVPFMVKAPIEEEAYLEGEIDLLAVNPTDNLAFVLDYKTGGSPDETPEQLQAKHSLQATCYAYAVLGQGYQQVDFAFVRVERDDVSQPGQPQIVRYSFKKEDLPEIEQVVKNAYYAAKA